MGEKSVPMKEDTRFDDAPPAYHDASTSVSALQPAQESAPPSAYSIFPKDIVFYRTENLSLLVGVPHEDNKPAPPTSFYVSIHMKNAITNKHPTPQIRLHYGPDTNYPVIGDVRFHSVTSMKSDITIWNNALVRTSGNTQALEPEIHVELTRRNALTTDTNVFTLPIPDKFGKLVPEKFEWRHSGDPEVLALAKENVYGEDYAQTAGGLKLVKVSTGEVIAGYLGGKHSERYNPKRIAGKIRFLGKEEGSEELRLMVVLSMMCIMEKK